MTRRVPVKREILIAEHAGACYGVNRALEIAQDNAVSAEVPLYTLGPLIHNPQVVSQLEAKGIRAVETPEEADPPATLIIRSHGVPPEVIERARGCGLDIVDATCPYVSKAQHAAAKLAGEGRLVIVVGEKGHPEVEGIVGHAGDNALIVASAAELPATLPEKVGVVVQTTQAHATFDAVVADLKARVRDLSVADTICLATQERQKAAAALADTVDAMVVVGGRNSGNTRRLHEICRAHCGRAFHVETADEVQPSWFEDCRRIGVTAGASTPAAQIDEVVARIRACGERV